MKLIHKFFAAFLLTSLLIIALMVGIMQYFASRHFDDYIDNVERERLANMVEILQEEYKEHHGWQHIEQNRFLWDQIVRSRWFRNDADRPPPSPGPGDVGMEGKLPANPMPPPPIINMVFLLDNQKQVIIGQRDAFQNRILREIRVDGKTVGWLGLARPKNIRGPLELDFIYRQTKAFILVGFGALILAAVVAFLLSRHLLRPIRKLMFGAHALASRRFETRVDVHSSDELGELAADFNRMAITLERYEHMRRQWISDISHELRTPLAVLRGEIEALMEGLRDLRKGTLESLHAEVMLLTKIVNDLHTLTIMESETVGMARQPLAVLDVMADILRIFQPKFAKKGIEVEKELSPDEGSAIVMVGDPDRLAQVFSNIFENTLRYTDAPGKIRIGYDLSDGSLHIYVDDSSPGVPDSAMPFIFDRLYRVDLSRSRKEGGSGLGLAISKAIIEGHDGKITATGSSLGGLRIEITLPLNKGIERI